MFPSVWLGVRALLTEDSEILRIVRGRTHAAPSLRAVRVVRGRGHGRGGDHLEADSLSVLKVLTLHCHKYMITIPTMILT